MPSGRICLGCGTLVVGMPDERCPPCQRAYAVHRQALRKAQGRGMKDTGARGRKRRALYDSREWREVRALVIQRDGSCRLCGITTRLTVHHIRPAADDDARALDMDNLVTLCRTCHGRLDGAKAQAHKRARQEAESRRPRTIGKRRT